MLRACQRDFDRYLGLNHLNDKNNFRDTTKFHGLLSSKLNYQIPRDSNLLSRRARERCEGAGLKYNHADWMLSSSISIDGL